MKEVQILFSSEMVKAIIAGKKSMTRRITKDNCKDLEGYQYVTNNSTYPEIWNGKKSEPYTGWIAKFNNLPVAMPRTCPYGQVGDILYVRELWRLSGWSFEDGEATIEYADGTKLSLPISLTDSYGEKFESEEWLINKVERLVAKGLFQPIGEPVHEEDEALIRTEKPYPFSPGIHLPKWGSRIWLQVTDVKVERLQDIAAGDAIAEGVEQKPGSDISSRFNYKHYEWETYNVDQIVSYRTLWESINGPESWNENPWVWVISFKVLSTTGIPENIPSLNKTISL